MQNRAALAVAGAVAISAIAFSQISIKTLLKTGGIVAVVSAFGKDMNNGLNSLWGRKDNADMKTKVVPIISVGSGTAVGAVQVMGPPRQVDRVVAVAQPELKILGEIRVRALIPVSDKNVKGRKGEGLSIVDEVGVSGIIDLKL